MMYSYVRVGGPGMHKVREFNFSKSLAGVGGSIALYMTSLS